jgi:outer membrane protein assembly factor BamB
MLISYRGFKELAFVSGSSGNIWALDADLERGFWQQHFDGVTAKGACSGAATPALNPPTNFSARKTGRPAAPVPTPIAKPTAVPPAFLRASGFGSARPVFTLSSDGKVHLLNTSNGEDMAPPLQFVPANARASSLTFADGYLYTTTTGKCGGTPDAVWAIDLSGATPAASFAPPAGGLPELGGVALGTDGTVYTRTKDGSVLALTAKELKPSPSFTAPTSAPRKKAVNSPTPLVFSYKDRDVIVSASEDGRLLLLDSQSMATPLFQTEPITTSGQIWGGLSSYEDAEGTRWIYAPVWGAVNAGVGTADNGAIVALKLEERDGKPALTPAWVSEDMNSPEPPVLTGGMVFALAAGKYSTDERPKGSHAMLYAFDAATGKEMYSTKDQVTVPASLSGVTLANARVYFTTVDNTLWAFGVYLER